MPTREQKLESYAEWRVTVMHCRPAVLKTTLNNLGGNDTIQQIRGGTLVDMKQKGDNWIVLRWNRPRKYDAVLRMVVTHIMEGSSVELEPVAPSPAQGDAPAAKVAGSAAPACLQRFSGGYLNLKFQSNQSILGHSAEPSTAGLAIFPDEVLGSGSFGVVFAAEYKGEKVVAKVFGRVSPKGVRHMKRQKLLGEVSFVDRLESARCEVAASAAFPPNKNILQLLDVSIWQAVPVLVYLRFDHSLRSLRKCRNLMEVERRHVMACLLQACAHLHTHGIVHADITATNALARGLGLKNPYWSDSVSCQQFCSDINRLPTLLEVVLSDLGSVEIGDPDQRLRNPDDVKKVGVVKTTLWYRAPELILGDVRFSFAIDVWSLGCLIVELVQGTPMFDADDQVQLLRMITRVFGSPRLGGGLSQLPFAALVPFLSTPTWPLKSVVSEYFMLDALTGMLDIEPAARISCATAEAQVAASVAPHVKWAYVAMGRGPCSVMHGHLEDHILQWLQADPYWSELRRCTGASRPTNLCMAASETEFKHEEGGHTRRQAPGCPVCNKVDMARPHPGCTGQCMGPLFSRTQQELADSADQGGAVGLAHTA